MTGSTHASVIGLDDDFANLLTRINDPNDQEQPHFPRGKYAVMRKSTSTRKRAKRTSPKGGGPQNEADIARALKDLNQLTPDSTKATQAITLFKTWLNDESGYDEETWPKLKRAINQQRAKVNARRLFDE